MRTRRTEDEQFARDHWPKVFSVVMAGGGIKGGVIHGMSDPTGAEPEEDAVHVPIGPPQCTRLRGLIHTVGWGPAIAQCRSITTGKW